MKYITIKKPYDLKLNNQITKFITPKYVALPLLEQIESKKTLVKKEEQITENIVSPVSGKIVHIDEFVISTGEKQQCLVIENNYKETVEKKNYVRKNITNLTKQELITELKQYHQEELAEKLKTKFATIICNTIEDEPYVENESFLSMQYTNILLEMLDALRIIYKIDRVQIVVQNSNRSLIEAFSNFLGTYPNIFLTFVPNYYLLEQEQYLKEYLHEENVIMLKPSEIYQIYHTVKRRKKLTEHIFTISGNAIKNPQVIEAKIGTSIKEIREELIEEMEKDNTIYINGLMKGRNFNIQKLIVTKELKSIFFMKHESIASEKCMNCGKCYQVCPVSCNPRAYLKNRKKQEIEQCIDCGLCSYICPSYINLRKEIQGD